MSKEAHSTDYADCIDNLLGYKETVFYQNCRYFSIFNPILMLYISVVWCAIILAVIWTKAHQFFGSYSIRFETIGMPSINQKILFIELDKMQTNFGHTVNVPESSY